MVYLTTKIIKRLIKDIWMFISIHIPVSILSKILKVMLMLAGFLLHL